VVGAATLGVLVLAVFSVFLQAAWPAAARRRPGQKARKRGEGKGGHVRLVLGCAGQG
jgi:hypothetical protein